MENKQSPLHLLRGVVSGENKTDCNSREDEKKRHAHDAATLKTFKEKIMKLGMTWMIYMMW
jgi:hypothetical protein